MYIDNNQENMTRLQLLLAEKRTSLAVIRVGIVVFALPLTILAALIAFSKQYEFQNTFFLMIPVIIVCTGLFVLGIFLIHRAVMDILRYGRSIKKMQKEHPEFFE